VGLEKFTDSAGDDLDTSLIMSFQPEQGGKGIRGGLSIINVGNNGNAPAFRHFSDIPDSGRRSGSMRLSGLTELANQTQDRGSRKLKFTITVHNKVAILDRLLSIFQTLNETLEPGTVTGPYLTFQPLTTPHIRNRDNALGLSDVAKPLVLVSLEMYWTMAEQSDLFHKSLRKLHDALSREAESLGMLHPFVYLNYAAIWQKPFDGYGKETCTLHRIQRRLQQEYDPDDRFRNLIPGGHRLLLLHGQCTGTDSSLR
jgi:hypothetical protein